MRPAGRGPLESLYFAYPHFDARRVPEHDGTVRRHRVAIVGAGPVGMTAALTLARYGVESVLLDRKDTFNDGSRATCLARASLHIFDRIGAVAPFLEKSLPWRYGRSYYREHQFYRLEMAHSDDERYLPMYNLQQQYVEQYLWDRIAAEPLIDARWQSEIVGIDARSDGASLRIDSPAGGYDLAADWVLVADGARSPTRGLMGLRLQGENYEGRYVIADVRMRHDFPTERRAFFESAGNPGGTVLMHKQPDDIWRVDYQLRDGEDEAAAVEEQNLRARVGAILTGIGHTGPWELEWWSIYSANTLCLDDYRHGRVVFMGDSAHIVPIFGVRGLNTGLADAHNIGWKLAYVLAGHASQRLLDSYTLERRGATLDAFANARKSTRFMTPPTRGYHLAREAALSLAIRHAFTRGLANPRQMSPYTYAGSPLTLADGEQQVAAGPVAGAVAPNVRLADGRHLLDLAGDGFTAMVFSSPQPDETPATWRAALGPLDPRATVLAIGGDAADAAGVTPVPDPAGAVARIFAAAPGTVVLLRPDLHIAGRWRAARTSDVAQSLAAALGRTTA